MIPIQTDQVDKGVNRLIFDLQGKENLVKLLTLFLNQTNDLEDANFSTLQERGIYEAIGFQLDLIGKIVGLPRNGLGDDDYRLALLIKIGVNTSDGTPNVMISLIKQYSVSDDVQIREGTIAFGHFIINGEATNTDKGMIALVSNIKPAGTRWVLHTDFYNNAFRPAFELSLGTEENFQVVLPLNVIENFEVTSNGIDFEPWEIVHGGILYYAPSTGNEKLYWETPLDLQVTSDGANYNTLETNSNTGASPKLRVAIPYSEGYLPKNSVPLTWEILDNSKSLVDDTGLYSLEQAANDLDEYVNDILPIHIN